jgi:hypothetical protein
VSEARELAEKRIQELAALPLEEVLRYEEQPVKERITGPSGRSYSSHTYAFSDTDPVESSLMTRVDVRGTGLHWWQRYHGTHLRWIGAEYEDDPPEEPEVSSTWSENCACLTLVLIVLGLPLSALYAIRKLFFS